MIQEKSNKDKKYIEELSDQELKNEILEINNYQLNKIASMSYYYFLSKSTELREFISNGSFKKEIRDIEEIKSLIESFEDLLDGFKGLVEEDAYHGVDYDRESLKKFRYELFSTLDALESYEMEVLYIIELLDHYIMDIRIDNEYVGPSLNQKDIELLIERVNGLLISNLENNRDYKNIVSSILNMLPFRVSQLKYYSLIKDDLTESFKEYPLELVENEIKRYKKIFYSPLIGDYGISFTPFFMKIEEVKKEKLESLDEDKLIYIYNEIEELIQDIDSLKEFVQELGVLCNRAILMHHLAGRIQFNKISKKLYSDWKNLWELEKTSDSKPIVERANNKLGSVESELMDNISYFEKVNNEAMERENLFDDKLEADILFSKKILAYYNDINFTKHEILFLENFEAIEKNHLENQIENMIESMRRTSKLMSNVERKLRMRRFLSQLHMPFSNIEDFLVYMEYSLDPRLTSDEEILLTMDRINYWLGKFKA